LGRNFFRRETEKAVALRRILVYQDHHPAVADLLETFFDARERHESENAECNCAALF
jgi:hypothetical protein